MSENRPSAEEAAREIAIASGELLLCSCQDPECNTATSLRELMLPILHRYGQQEREAALREARTRLCAALTEWKQGEFHDDARILVWEELEKMIAEPKP